MKAFFSRLTITVLFLNAFCHAASGQSNSNFTAIRNANIQIRASLQNTPLAWASDNIAITVNKQTGDFQAKLLVDNLHFATPNAAFNGQTGENKGKYLILAGILPVDDVLSNANNAIDRKIQITANFNDQDYLTPFTFTILKMSGGFSVMANGALSHSALEIDNLSELDDELVIILSFTGY